MKIYTKTGDDGETGLFAGPRVQKDDLRIEAYGAVDELNSVLGMARAEQPPVDIDQLLASIQNELFAVGAELATPDPAKHGTDLIGDAHIAALEAAIDRYETGLEPLKQFILPGGTKAAAALHLARSVCRRAERRVVTLFDEPDAHVSERMIRYLNRLSDLLFVLSRAANSAAGCADVAWQKPARS
jgi:cob(I)alamin adenosyltransferase